MCCRFFVCKQKTAYEMRISDWSSDVCSSDLKASDHRMLLAAAEKHLRAELARRATALAEGDDAALSLIADPGTAPRLAWHGDEIGRASCRERVCQYV